MWKKLLIALLTFAGTFSVGYMYFNTRMSAAALNAISDGEQIIVGTDSSGNETVWTVSKNNGSYYTMYYNTGTSQICNDNTNNTFNSSGTAMAGCDIYTTAAGKSHSATYLSAKAYNDAYASAITQNPFESAAVQSISGNIGGLQYAYLPSAAQTISGNLGSSALPQSFIIGERGYVKHNSLWQNAVFSKTDLGNPSGRVYPSATSTTAYPASIGYTWGWMSNLWYCANVVVFSHLNHANIAYVLNSSIQKDVLTANPRSGVLKIRYSDSAYNVTFNDMKYNGQSVAGRKVVKDATIQMDAVASDTLSVFVFDDAGNNLLYYKALNNNNFDLTGIPTGKYKIAVANEAFDDTTGRAAKSSSISAMKSLEIVAPHKLTYTQTPQSGATSGAYEFSKNVNAGQAVGKVTVNPQGVMPLTYTLTTNGDNSYQNFEIDGLNTSNASSSTTLNVKIKSGAPDLVNGGLKAGTYQFCISAQDNNGYPATPSISDQTKVCTSFDVKKTKPTITFDNDDQGTTYVSGSTMNTTTHREHATHTNQDITDNDVNVEYTYVSGNSTILSGGLPFTSAMAGDHADIIFNANMSGSIVIQAKIPASDNYEQAITTKTLVLQLGITANYVEDKTNITAGTSAAKPPTSYIPANRIGHVDVNGGTSPFTYSLPSGQGDNGSFYIDSNGNVYVNTSVGSSGLTPGNYTIAINVRDNTSPTNQTTTVTKTITVSAATLTGVGWEDPQHLGNALPSNTYTITYDPSGEPSNGGSFHTKLIETANGALSNTVITYTLDPNPNNVISISGSSTVNVTVKGASDASALNNVKIKAHISGGIYGSTGVDTELLVNVKKYPQTIAFPNTSLLKLPVGGACVSVPANITSTYSKSGETVQYTSSNTSANAPFTINANGEVCPTSNASDAGSATLMGTLNGDNNYETATTPTGRVIQVYVPGSITVSGSIDIGPTPNVTYTPDTTLKKALHTTSNPNGGTATRGTAVAQVSVSGSTYTKSTNSGSQNADASLFTVTSTGYITLNQNITANDLAGHGTQNQYYIQVDVTDSNGNTRTVDVIIVIEDAKADFYFIDPIRGTKLNLTDTYGTINVPVYRKTYAPNGTIDVKTNLDSTYSEVTVAESPGISVDEDVIDHNTLNHFNILNASDPSGLYGNGGDAYVKACMSANNGYGVQCIYAKVIIEQAEQDNFAFVNQPRWLVGKAPATIQPTYNGKMSQGEVVLSSSNNTIAEVLPPVSGQDQSFKTMNVVGTATLTATAPEDRNYKAKQATTILETTERPPTSLNLFVPGMTYGDTNVQARITTGYKNGVPAYFYVDDDSILTINNNPVTTRNSPAMSAMGSGQVIVKVCQTNDAFDPATDDCNAIGGDYGEQIIIVKKKPITLSYADEEIYVGEAFPQYRFITPPTNMFAFQDSINDFPIPINTSAKKNGTTITDTKQVGTYDISGRYAANELNGNTEHYDITLQSGKLIIKQDQAQSSWYHLEDSSGNTVSADDWHNEIIDVVIDRALGNAGSYDQISNTMNFTNVNKQRFTVTKEDDNVTDIYFRIDPNGSEPHKGAISEKLQDHVKIDMTDPKITGITGYPVNTSGISNILNEITLGHYFKPGVEIEIKVEDPKPQGNNSAKISGIKEVSYEVFELDGSGNMVSATPIEADTGTPGRNNVLSFKMNAIGNYRVCATTVDNATNQSEEKCSDINIKKIDVDVDGDGEPDFNDPDGDGCPDLNIKWKGDDGKWVIINGDRDYDGIPDLNIDSDGDGIPDLNLDTDGDGKPDLNLVILKKSDWKPTICVNVDEDKGIKEEYCTGTSVKAQINVDLDDDGIPDINIDNKGDFKPHINIAKDGETPTVNIAIIHTWKPDKNYKQGKFEFDTMGIDEKKEVLINIDTDGDGYPDVNIDLDDDGEPDINKDIDGDWIPDIDIDSTGDGIPDVNVDTDGDGEPNENIIEITVWKPEHNVDDPFTYDTMTSFDEPEDPNEPENPKDQDPSSTDVDGNYYPGSNMGGALTGDTTNIMMYMGIGCMALGMICLLLYKCRTDHK